MAKKILSIIVAVLFTILCFSSYSIASEAASQDSPEVLPYRDKPSIGKTFEGEELTYRIAFWWFSHAADGGIKIERDGDDYLITLYAETTGFIGWVTRYRKDIYKAYVEEINNGRRFRTKTFERESNISGRVRKSIITMDYENGIMKEKSWGGGKEEKYKEEPIPEGVLYDDPLTAFYNFRHGAYGPIEKGREYTITTFPKEGVSNMYVRLLTDEEKTERLKEPDTVDYLADIRIDKELFGSQTGEIEAFFTKELIPVSGVMKDMLFFGDVRGTLVEIGTKMDLKKSAKTN
jgi:hypothetical protein